jgi:chromate transport protein ChrA
MAQAMQLALPGPSYVVVIIVCLAVCLTGHCCLSRRLSSFVLPVVVIILASCCCLSRNSRQSLSSSSFDVHVVCRSYVVVMVPITDITCTSSITVYNMLVGPKKNLEKRKNILSESIPGVVVVPLSPQRLSLSLSSDVSVC